MLERNKCKMQNWEMFMLGLREAKVELSEDGTAGVTVWDFKELVPLERIRGREGHTSTEGHVGYRTEKGCTIEMENG